MMTETVYIAVLEDRHFDDQIEVFRGVINAMLCVAGWAQEYKDRYVFEAHRVEGWVAYLRTEGDDGPKMRIEKRELR